MAVPGSNVQQTLVANLQPTGNNLQFDLLAAPTDGVDPANPANNKITVFYK